MDTRPMMDPTDKPSLMVIKQALAALGAALIGGGLWSLARAELVGYRTVLTALLKAVLVAAGAAWWLFERNLTPGEWFLAIVLLSFFAEVAINILYKVGRYIESQHPSAVLGWVLTRMVPRLPPPPPPDDPNDETKGGGR